MKLEDLLQLFGIVRAEEAVVLTHFQTLCGSVLTQEPWGTFDPIAFVAKLGS